MTGTSAVRHPVQTAMRVRTDLAEHRATSRVSAYIYGDILVLASTAGASQGAIRSGEALFLVLGTMVSTYVAHVLSDVIGAVFGGHELKAALSAELRDSVPVVSAGLPSCVLFAAAAIGWPPPIWAQSIAAGALILRLAGIGLIYRRLREDISIDRALWIGLATALVAALAAALKLVIAH